MVLNESYYKLDIVKKVEDLKKQNIELCYLLDKAIKIIKELKKNERKL